MRAPRDFFAPLAIGAPEPLREIPKPLSRMLHFFDPSNARMVVKVSELAPRVDVLVGNLEHAVDAANKSAARAGLVELARTAELGDTALWTRINNLGSPWALDDLCTLVTEAGNRIDVIMVPKVNGPEDVHYLDRLLAQLEVKGSVGRPVLLHPIVETPGGVAQFEQIAQASPRVQGMSFSTADLARNRHARTTQSGRGHPDYLVRDDPGSARATYQQDMWHYTLSRMVDACVDAGISPYMGPFGDLRDLVGCKDQFRSAHLLGCVGTWTLHPSQIEVAREVFGPDADDIAWAQRVAAERSAHTGAVITEGKIHDRVTSAHADATLAHAARITEHDGTPQP